jgi:hypothetical protein
MTLEPEVARSLENNFFWLIFIEDWDSAKHEICLYTISSLFDNYYDLCDGKYGEQRRDRNTSEEIVW